MYFTTVYNTDNQPLEVIPAMPDALYLILKEKVIVLEEFPEAKVRSQYLTWNLPKSVVLLEHANVGRKYTKRARIAPKKLFIRDDYTCQYCGRHVSELNLPNEKRRMTQDHILPRSRGGAHRWENLVTACPSCNNKKDDRTPAEAGMRLLRKPYAPTSFELAQKSNAFKEQKKNQY